MLISVQFQDLPTGFADVSHEEIVDEERVEEEGISQRQEEEGHEAFVTSWLDGDIPSDFKSSSI